MDKTTKLLSPVLIAGTLFSLQVSASMPPGFNVNNSEAKITLEKQFSQNYSPSTAIKMFPAPKHGFTQQTLHFTQVENEDLYRIEVQVGKYKNVDCNRHFLSGTLSETALDGWGYKYWQSTEIGEGGSTRMMCPPGSETNQFVAISDTVTIHYNSQLPAVFYVPEGINIRYKVWTQTTDFMEN